MKVTVVAKFEVDIDEAVWNNYDDVPLTPRSVAYFLEDYIQFRESPNRTSPMEWGLKNITKNAVTAEEQK